MPGSGRSLSSPDPQFQGEPWRYYYDKIQKKIITSSDPRTQYHPVFPTKKNWVNLLDGKIIPLVPSRMHEVNDEGEASVLLLQIALAAMKSEDFFKKGQDIEGVIAANRGYGETTWGVNIVQSRVQGNVPPLDITDEYGRYVKKKAPFLREWLEKAGAQKIKDLGFYGKVTEISESEWTGKALFDSLS